MLPKRNELGFGMRAGTDLIAGILVGVGIGFLLDYAFDTKPIFLILFFFVGSAAGIMNVMRSAKEAFMDEEKNNKDQDTES